MIKDGAEKQVKNCLVAPATEESMTVNFRELVDEHLFTTLISEGEEYLSKLQREKDPDYDSRVYTFRLSDLFLEENNQVVEGVFQQLRFNIFKHFLSLLKVKTLVPGFSGFDLVLQYEDHNELFVLVDKWDDLDDELIAILYHKCQAYLERNPQDRCTAAEIFGPQNISRGWTGGDPETDSKLSWISRDNLFRKILGNDIFPEFFAALKDCEAEYFARGK